MHNYFIQRILHKRSFQIALATGMLLSLFYLGADIFPNRFYNGTPYTRWIESFTASQIPYLLFMIMPIIAAMTAADIYASDQNNGFFKYIFVKGKSTKYFIFLYLYNFIAAGLCFISPLLINMYGCFMLLENRKPDLILTVSEPVPLRFSTTLFPELYYRHPLLHMFMYVAIAFLVAGMYATIALASSFFIKKSFLIMLSAFGVDYIWTYLIPESLDSGISYLPTVFSREVSSPILEWSIMLSVFLGGMIIASIGYLIGVKKYVIK